MPGIFRGPFCDCALWSLWEVFFLSFLCRTLGSAVSFTASRFQGCLCGVILSWYSSCVGLSSLGVFFLNSAFQNPQPKYSAVCFLMHWFLMSNSMGVCVCVCECVSIWLGYRFGSKSSETACVCVCVCVWSTEGWGGSVADMKVKGESCLPPLPLGEPSGSWKSPGLPLSFSCL